MREKIANKLKFYRDRRVLITGASGLLGSHLLDLLLGSCKEIRVLTRKKPASYGKSVKAIQGDIRAIDAEAIIKDVDVVFHLAAVVSVDRSIVDPFETLNTNLISTVKLLEAARKRENEPRIIFSSSSSIYGASQAKITENHIISPSNPYSASKAAADIICQAYVKTYGLPIVILRPSSIYGPRQRTTQFIPTVILQCLSKDVLEIGPLNTYRDFCYVKDVAAAFAMAGATPEAVGQIFNVSMGKSIKIADIVEKTSRLLDKRVEIKKKTNFYRLQETTSPFIIDSSKSRKVLGWRPIYNIDSGLSETIEWFKSLCTPEKG